MKYYPVNEPLLNGNEKKYLMECIDTGWISSEGPFISRFEREFSEKVSRKFGIAVSNGTAALDIAYQALELSPGDEVIVPTFTIISCVQHLIRLGVKPVFVDCSLHDWNVDVDKIEALITDKTKALLIVHIYGICSNIAKIMQIADKHNLKVIEDAAEMHGQFFCDKPIGSFGDLSIFSFYPNKHITTGEGGMIVTNDEELYLKCASLRNLCFKPEQRFLHDQIGWNYRMSNLQAAVGCAQLERLDEFVAKKRKMGQIYHSLIGDIDHVSVQPPKTDYCDNIYWVFGIVLDKNLGVNAKAAMADLARLGIGTRPFFYPLHRQPIVKEVYNIDISLPNSEYISDYGFYIPSGLKLEETEAIEIGKIVKNYLATLR